jgi:hypothetical protein
MATFGLRLYYLIFKPISFFGFVPILLSTIKTGTQPNNPFFMILHIPLLKSVYFLNLFDRSNCIVVIYKLFNVKKKIKFRIKNVKNQKKL